ncbi:MAG: hypothetical protein WD929_07950 [Steroidobacteraceae bacterium]
MNRLILATLVMAVSASAVAEPQNPPPANALAGYDKYELAAIAMGAPYAGDKGKEAARQKIQDYMTVQTGLIVEQWNADAAGNTRGQSLVIEPRIEKLKVVSGGARFWAGAMAGDSYVVMKFRFVEQPSGKLLAEPEFYQRAAAMSGAWTFGGQDKDMLHRIVGLANHYLRTNYESPVGGPTGYDPQ